MKKLILTLVLLGTMLASGCAIMPAQAQTTPDETEYAYTDDYTSVDWANAEMDIMYSYYDFSNLFLVVYGGRIFIMPYDYFYGNLYNRYSLRMHWYSYDYFSAWWGTNYYNRLWSNYYYRHNRGNWRGDRDWYRDHKRFNSNRDFHIRRNGLRNPYYPRLRNKTDPAPLPNRRYQAKPRSYTPRSYTPRSYTPRSYTPRSYTPRSYTPRSYTPRSFGGSSGGYHATPRSFGGGSSGGGHGGARKKD